MFEEQMELKACDATGKIEPAKQRVLVGKPDQRVSDFQLCYCTYQFISKDDLISDFSLRPNCF